MFLLQKLHESLFSETDKALENRPNKVYSDVEQLKEDLLILSEIAMEEAWQNIEKKLQ